MAEHTVADMRGCTCVCILFVCVCVCVFVCSCGCVAVAGGVWRVRGAKLRGLGGPVRAARVRGPREHRQDSPRRLHADWMQVQSAADSETPRLRLRLDQALMLQAPSQAEINPQANLDPQANPDSS
eukprot:1264593-Rhodomonas_salina.2